MKAMRKVLNILLVMLLFTGCAEKPQPVNTPTPPNTAPAAPSPIVTYDVSPSPQPSPSPQSSPAPEPIDPSVIFGTWVVIERYITARIHGMEDDEIEAYIGAEVEFGTDFARLGDTLYSGITYNPESVHADKFNAWHGFLRTSDFGFTGDYAMVIQCVDADGNDRFGKSDLRFYGEIIIPSADTIYMERSGVHFKLARAPGS
ncbi:MAG: hypothetical protein LBT12_00185 [Oscillospiraceae bacterium]|jgi:hypothetical protein|nr:hypothetical protein [Oscillospiraceae bacterium]